MNLEKILAISGMPGIYTLKLQTRTGFIAESLIDGKRVSLLSEISVYTYEAEMPLAEVMRAIAAKENNGPAISHKEDTAKLVAYFKEIMPNYDEDRVYASDIKKILHWYGILQNKGLVSAEEPSVSEEARVQEIVKEKVAAANESKAKSPSSPKKKQSEESQSTPKKKSTKKD
jgi:hypothetical protein